MTREEQIREAAKKNTGLFSFMKGYSTAEDAFVAGAKWADNNPDAECEARKKYRREVSELAKQLLPECSFDIREAFAQAEQFVLSKYSYILTGDINYKRKQ